MNRYLLICLLIFLYSCKEDKKNVDFEKPLITYDFDFPDTVFVGKKYNGNLYYKGNLDTIVDNFDDKENYRYAYYIMRISNNINISTKNLRKLDLDSLGAQSNGKIPLFNIEFPEEGIYYLDGIISDYVYMKTDKKNKNGEPLERNIAHESRANHKVIVIESIK